MATVLLAEDDADIRFLVTFKLERAGHEVRGFPDVMMPGMSGLDVCRELRRDPATAAVPVILLTACAEDADVAAGFAAGADDYIIKPFSPRDLAMRVKAVLDRVRA